MNHHGHHSPSPQLEENGLNPGLNPGQTTVHQTANRTSETTREHLNTLLGGSPVLEATSASDEKGRNKPALATANDFELIDSQRPFAQTVGPKVLLASGLALCLVLPTSIVFRTSKKTKSAAVPETAHQPTQLPTAEPTHELEALRQENEAFKAQQAFDTQQLDMEAIEAEGRRKQAQAQAQKQASEIPTTAPATAPEPTTVTAQPVAARPAPAPRARLAPRPAATVRSRRTAMPVDPYAQRAQLQKLGVYGSPPPVKQAASNATLARHPLGMDSGHTFIQALSIAPEPTVAEPTFTREQVAKEPTIEDTTYQEDAALVLGNSWLAPAAEATVASPTETAPPTAIMPGTTVTAQIPYGFQWRQGLAPPEVLLTLREDIMAGAVVALPAGTQMLASANVDPISGATEMAIKVLFGEGDIQIPQSSIVVHAEDGSPLIAQRSGGPTIPGPNFGGMVADSLANGLANVINSDDNLAIDIAGGVAEAVIEHKRETAHSRANDRAARVAAQPMIWTLAPGTVRITFNNFVPLTVANR